MDIIFFLRSVGILILALTTFGFCGEQKLKRGQGAVEGFVRLEGEPVRDIQLWVIGAPYEKNNSWAVPIITSKAIGVVGVNAPPTESDLYGRWTTDKKGHYELVLPPGRFLIYSKSSKKDARQALVPVHKTVLVKEGERVEMNWDLSGKWSQAEQLKGELSRSLQQLAAAAKEEYPMRSILFMPRGDNSVWMASVALPGADRCTIMSFNSIMINSQNIALPIYDCVAQYTTREAAEAGYQLLVKLVADATGWSKVAAARGNNTIFSFSGLPEDDEVSVSLGNENRVSFSYTTFKRSPEYKRIVQQTDHSQKINEAIPAADAAIQPQSEAIPQTRQTTGNDQMAFGSLAVLSDAKGTLFVDGERTVALDVDKITTVKLTAGEHFVDLRDVNGSKLWERVVSIPIGRQVVERIVTNIVR